eukprot:878518-Lingulodinium_polyedra.AAC.1
MSNSSSASSWRRGGGAGSTGAASWPTGAAGCSAAWAELRAQLFVLGSYHAILFKCFAEMLCSS